MDCHKKYGCSRNFSEQLDVLLNLGCYGLCGKNSALTPFELTILIDHHGRHSLYSKALSEIRVFVHIDLEDLELIAKFFFDLLDEG